MRTIEQMISSEVLCCMSHLVATLAGADYPHGADDLGSLMDQAQELAAPIEDWEEAAIQAGWRQLENGGWYHDGEDDGDPGWADSAQDACETDNLDPYQSEVFEHWAVTDWFADQLAEQGERVDKDFAGLCVWARTTSGQAISADSVIERIYAATHESIVITRDGGTYLWATHSSRGLLDREQFKGLAQVDVLTRRLREAYPNAEIIDSTVQR